MLSTNSDKDLRRSLDTGYGRTARTAGWIKQPQKSFGCPGWKVRHFFTACSVRSRSQEDYIHRTLNGIELYLNAKCKGNPANGTIETRVRVRFTAMDNFLAPITWRNQLGHCLEALLNSPCPLRRRMLRSGSSVKLTNPLGTRAGNAANPYAT